MCIRDRTYGNRAEDLRARTDDDVVFQRGMTLAAHAVGRVCLLYTSDAADERSSVDLGGRRIIKKKKKLQSKCGQHR